MYPEKDITHKNKFSLLKEGDSEDDQLYELGEMDKAQTAERAVLHFNQLYTHVDKLDQLHRHRGELDIRSPLMKFLIELEK